MTVCMTASGPWRLMKKMKPKLKTLSRVPREATSSSRRTMAYRLSILTPNHMINNPTGTQTWKTNL